MAVAPLALLYAAATIHSAPIQQRLSTPKSIYLKRCGSCHGAKGEGGKGYSRPLTGSKSISDLSKYIAANMPPGQKKCSINEAKSLAPFIYNSFYSAIAQERNRPARVSLSRLTVTQYQNAVADLIGSFTPSPKLDGRHGLIGEYFKYRNFDGKDRLIQRLDQEVKFDFGNAAPQEKGFDPHHFSISWEGSVLAPDTGEYEFNVRTDHAVYLYLNNGKTPLVDAWVKSGSDVDHRGTIKLIAGRYYPLRIEFSKSTQGVNDDAQTKNKPPAKAFFELCWSRPKLAEEVIPSRCLVPVI